jgi:hypothetical protein
MSAAGAGAFAPGSALTRVRFLESAPAGARALMSFTEPRPAAAVAESAEPASPPAAGADELLFLLLPAGSAQPEALRAQAELWVGPGALRVRSGPGWLWWRPGRAALVGPAEAHAPMLAAAADFAFYEGELRALERELAADWPQAQADLPLAHEIAGPVEPRCRQLQAMTVRTLERRVRHVRVEPRLLSASAELEPEARGAADRLREKAGVEARLETVDGQLETYEYIYELANQRMSEHRHFRTERALEVAIVVLLAVEILLMFYECFG